MDLYRPLILLCCLTALAGCDTEEVPPPSDVVLRSLDLVSVAENHPDGAFFSAWAGNGSTWIAGGTSDRSVVLQYDGADWTTHDPGLGRQLWWVHGYPGGPVDVVGAGGAIGRYQDGQWTAMDSGVPTTLLYGIWGSGPDDVWACGGTWSGVADSEGDVVIHYDGAAWSRVPVPALENKPASAQKDLFKVWGADANHVFIVGSGGTALHWDGTGWRKEDTGTNEVLFTVAGRSATDVYAIGGLGLGVVLLHWDGDRWSEVVTPEFAPGQTPGLWTAPGEAVYIAGLSGYTARLNPDGTWLEGDVVSADSYHGIHGDGQAIWAVGGDITSPAPSRGAIAVAGRQVPSLP